MTEVGKNKLNHPSLGTAGGAGLHSQMEGIFTEISNNLPARWKLYSAVANSTTLTFEHNLQVPLSDLRLHIYTSSGGVQTRLTDLTGWTIGATSGFAQSKVDITVPSSGGPFTFYLYISHEPMSDKLNVAGGTLTGNVSLSNSYRITNSADPSAAQDLATKNYVDSVAQGLDVKYSVKAATTSAAGNITLSGTQTIDTVALVAGDRVLVKNQTTASQNGIYVVASGAWSRASDMDSWTEVPGAFCFVEQGGQADTGWVCVADQGGTIGTTAMSWSQFAGVGTYSGTNAIAVSGTTISINIDGTTLSQSSSGIKVADGQIGATQLANSAVDLAGTKVTGLLPVTSGGTGSNNPASARSALAAAKSGPNSDITQITGLTTMLAVDQGGTGGSDAASARTNLSAAKSGANSDITQITGLTTPLAVNQGGTGAASPNAALNALLPSQATYANKYLKTDGTNTSWVSASGGAGEINAVLNSSAADNNTDNWVAGALHTITPISGSLSPLHPVVTTGFSIASTGARALLTNGNTEGGYALISNMPVGLRNRKLKIEFYYTTPASSDGTWSVQAYKYDENIRIPLSTDSGNETILPSSVTGGKFVAYFDTDGSTTRYAVNLIQRTRTNANTLYVTNVIVGPGIQPQGAVVSEWQSYTPTVNNSAGLTHSGNYYWRRIGDSIELSGDISFSTGTGTSPSSLTVTIPNGLNVDITKTTASGGGTDVPVGPGYFYDASVGTTTYLSVMCTNGTTPHSVYFIKSLTLDSIDGNEFEGGDSLGFRAVIPISEWSGSGTLNLAQNDVEYAYNQALSSSVADDLTSFGYGPSGGYFPGTPISTPAGVRRRVSFKTPIQPSDTIILEMDPDGDGKWVEVNGSDMIVEAGSATVTSRYDTQGANAYGFGRLRPQTSTDIDVWFGRYRTGTSDWSAATDACRWRLKKVSGGAAVGFGHASATESGLVNTTTQTFAGHKTFAGITEFQNAIKARSAATITDNLDVSGINLLFFGAGTTTINGLSGGTVGQIIYVYGSSGSARLILTHNNASGTQKFLNPGNLDLSSAGGYGGLVLYCNGTFWYPMSTAQTHRDYSATLASGSWTGAGGTPHVLGSGATSTLSLTRVGKIVTFRLTVTTGTSPGSTYASATGSNIIPDWAQPLSTVYVMQPYNFATTDFAFLQISSSGTLVMDLRRMYSATGERVAFGASQTLLPMIGSWVID